jgi:hypothetical protein
MGKSSRSTLGTQNPSPEATNPATTPPPEEPINIFVPMILEREREREREALSRFFTSQVLIIFYSLILR